MTHTAWAFAATAGVLLTAAVGCYHPGPYGPNYGYPTAPPGAYPVAPGGTYVAPGTSVPGMLGPTNTFPGGSGPTLAPPINGGDAPPYTFEGGANSSGGSVPMYDDPNAGDIGNPPPDDGFRPATNNGGANGSPYYEGTALPRPLDVGQAMQPVQSKPSDYFAGLDEFDATGSMENGSPTGVSPASFESVSVEEFGSDPTATPVAARNGQDGFDYDRAAYRWLRGVIDYDPRHKDWHIIYGLPPDPADKFGGSLTLADGGRLKDFQDDDVILVEGWIDSSAGRDALGKPLYRVTRAELVGRFE